MFHFYPGVKSLFLVSFLFQVLNLCSIFIPELSLSFIFYSGNKSVFSLFREMSRVQLMALGERSASCEQYFKYTCQNSPIL